MKCKASHIADMLVRLLSDEENAMNSIIYQNKTWHILKEISLTTLFTTRNSHSTGKSENAQGVSYKSQELIL